MNMENKEKDIKELDMNEQETVSGGGIGIVIPTPWRNPEVPPAKQDSGSRK